MPRRSGRVSGGVWMGCGWPLVSGTTLPEKRWEKLEAGLGDHREPGSLLGRYRPQRTSFCLVLARISSS